MMNASDYCSWWVYHTLRLPLILFTTALHPQYSMLHHQCLTNAITRSSLYWNNIFRQLSNNFRCSTNVMVEATYTDCPVSIESASDVERINWLCRHMRFISGVWGSKCNLKPQPSLVDNRWLGSLVVLDGRCWGMGTIKLTIMWK